MLTLTCYIKKLPNQRLMIRMGCQHPLLIIPFECVSYQEYTCQYRTHDISHHVSSVNDTTLGNTGKFLRTVKNLRT